MLTIFSNTGCDEKFKITAPHVDFEREKLNLRKDNMRDLSPQGLLNSDFK